MVDIFFISFTSFGAFFDCLHLNSSADRLAMVKKEVSGPSGNLLRILGTYVYNPRSSKQPCAWFVGRRCGRSMKRPRQSNDGKPQDRAVSVLLRDSREWSVEDKGFLHPLRVCKRIPTAVLNPTANPLGAANSSCLLGFKATWRTVQAVRSTMWSESLTRTSQVIGILEVSVPFVQCTGNVLSVEFGNCLSEEILSESVK